MFWFGVEYGKDPTAECNYNRLQSQVKRKNFLDEIDLEEEVLDEMVKEEK